MAAWRPCTCDVQKHPRLAEIESALWRGWEPAQVAKYFALHPMTIKAHWEKHMRGKKAAMGDIGPPVTVLPPAPPTSEEEEAALDALSTLAAAAEPPPPPEKRPRGRPKGKGWAAASRHLAKLQRRTRRPTAKPAPPPPTKEAQRRAAMDLGESPPDSMRDILTEEEIEDAAPPSGAEKDPEFTPEAMQEVPLPAPAPGEEGQAIHSRNLSARCRAAGSSWHKQVEFLSYLLDSGKFYFGHTLEWARTIWGLTLPQIKTRFESAVKRCSGYRQSVIAQTIACITAFELQEREAMAAWNRSKRLNDPKPEFLRIATTARRNIVYAAGIGHQTLKVDANVWVRPEFVQAVDQLTEVALDTLVPTADERFNEIVALVEERLGKKADPGVVAAVLETASVVMGERLQVLAKQSEESVPPTEGEMDLLPPEEGTHG